MEKIEILWQIFAAFSFAKVLGFFFKRIKQPEVIGELLAGAILGPYILHLFAPEGFISIFAEIGVIILLFLVGLETKIDELKEVGAQAVSVGILGVLFPFAFGFATGRLWGYPFVENLFLGTILVATSVGITIRVLSELGYIKRKSAKIILGAAVLDDILSLIILSIVKNVALGKVNWFEITLLIVEAGFFIFFLLSVGTRIIRRSTKKISVLLTPPLRFELSLIFCLGLSLLAEYIGLAAIVGAFMAGLVLSESSDYEELIGRFEPIGWFLTPFFFILMGSFINPYSFLEGKILLVMLVLTLVAIFSKAVGSYLGAIRSKRQTALEVAIGMIPRGEVGIVIAGIGLSSKAIELEIYTAAMGMVILTTFITPFLIKAFYKR
jgi:Kef-type K+ transport system membrane component KefB